MGMGMKTLRDRADRLALFAALIAALGVSGCGRKGPLDPPPAALSDSQSTPGTNAQLATQRPSLGEEGNSLVPTLEPLAQPQRPQQASTTPPPPPKTFFLDFLINK
jgi:predicted small lipoprotein YifL